MDRMAPCRGPYHTLSRRENPLTLDPHTIMDMVAFAMLYAIVFSTKIRGLVDRLLPFRGSKVLIAMLTLVVIAILEIILLDVPAHLFVRNPVRYWDRLFYELNGMLFTSFFYGQAVVGLSFLWSPNSRSRPPRILLEEVSLSEGAISGAVIAHFAACFLHLHPLVFCVWLSCFICITVTCLLGSHYQKRMWMLRRPRVWRTRGMLMHEFNSDKSDVVLVNGVELESNWRSDGNRVTT